MWEGGVILFEKMVEISVKKRIDFGIYQEYLIEDERREEQNDVADHPYIKQYEYYAFRDFNKFLDMDIDDVVVSRRLMSSIDATGKCESLSWGNLFEAYADYLKSKDSVSEGTAQNRFIYISKYFRNATLDADEKEQLNKYIESAKDRLDPREYSSVNYWEQDEVIQLIYQEWNPKYELLWRLMYRHARRVGEVQLVKWTDIAINSEQNIEANADIDIPTENAIRYPEILKKQGDVSYVLPLNDRMVELIKALDKSGEYVFGGRGEGPITQSTIREHLDRLSKKCEDVTNSSKTHRFRHSRGVHMRQQGEESVKARELMQHAYTSTTEDFYWQDLSSDERDSLYDTIFDELDQEDIVE